MADLGLAVSTGRGLLVADQSAAKELVGLVVDGLARASAAEVSAVALWGEVSVAESL